MKNAQVTSLTLSSPQRFNPCAGLGRDIVCKMRRTREAHPIRWTNWPINQPSAYLPSPAPRSWPSRFIGRPSGRAVHVRRGPDFECEFAEQTVSTSGLTRWISIKSLEQVLSDERSRCFNYSFLDIICKIVHNCNLFIYGIHLVAR